MKYYKEYVYEDNECTVCFIEVREDGTYRIADDSCDDFSSKFKEKPPSECVHTEFDWWNEEITKEEFERELFLELV